MLGDPIHVRLKKLVIKLMGFDYELSERDALDKHHLFIFVRNIGMSKSISFAVVLNSVESRLEIFLYGLDRFRQLERATIVPVGQSLSKRL